MEQEIELLRDFFSVERRFIPDSTFRFKNRCFFSKVRAFYARPFNYRYLTDFTTTIYPITYFPSAAHVREAPYGATETEFHEFVHKWDRSKDGFLFNIKYLYPQVFAVPLILATIAACGTYCWAALAIFIGLFHLGLLLLHVATGKPGGKPKTWGYITFYILTAAGLVQTVAATILFGKGLAILWLAPLLFTSPWPLKAKWRRDYEIRGYTMSFYAQWLNRGTVSPLAIERRVKSFTGPDYFFMETDEKFVRNELLFQVGRFPTDGFEAFFKYRYRESQGATQKTCTAKQVEMAQPYQIVRYFMGHRGLIKKKK